MSENNDTAPANLSTVAVLRTIAADMHDDAKAAEGAPFTGETVGTYLGGLGASIATVAEILADALAAPCAHCGETSAFPGGAR